MNQVPATERQIQMGDLDPKRLGDELRTALVELSQLVGLAMSEMTVAAAGSPSGGAVDLSLTLETVLPMVDGVRTSLSSIIRLTGTVDEGIRDCYGIARSVCEGSLNIAYILACGADVASRARRHAMQKSYRDMARVEQIGDFRVAATGLSPPHDIPGMEDAISEFTRRNGSEITEWSGLSLHEKRDAIIARYPGLRITITASITGFYRTSSELLHGTFAGAELFWTAGGAVSPSVSEFERTWAERHLVPIFSSVWAAVLAMLEVVDEELDLPELGRAKRAWLGKVLLIFDPVITQVEPSGGPQ